MEEPPSLRLGDPALLDLYSLLGDPALLLHALPEAPRAGAEASEE
jgi:hypothetical protein